MRILSATAGFYLALLAISTYAYGAHSWECETTVLIVEDRTPLVNILDFPGANTSWITVCLDNGLLDLSSCLFPPVGTELLVDCHNDTVGIETDFAAMLNLTTFDAFTDAMAELLSSFVHDGVLSPDNAIQLQIWLGPFIYAAYPMAYDTRSSGACGANALGLNLPADLVGPDINKCCVEHDNCFNACSSFNGCNREFESCLVQACNKLPKPSSWLDWYGWAVYALKKAACDNFRNVATAAVSSTVGQAVYCCANDNNPLACTGAPCPVVSTINQCYVTVLG